MAPSSVNNTKPLPDAFCETGANSAAESGSANRISVILQNKSSKFEIVPAPLRRYWMERFPFKQPYKCLPLAIANQYGWMIRNPQTFSAEWNGGNSAESIIFFDGPGYARPHLGGGTITFGFDFLFKTSPGVSLWIRGLPNFFIDGIHALEGIVETDWLPFVASMTWRFTRPHFKVTFEEGAPICFVTPVRRNELEEFGTSTELIESMPDFKKQVAAYTAERVDFTERIMKGEALLGEWQGYYMRGVLPDGTRAPASHKTKVLLAKFPAGSDIDEV